MDQGTPGSLSPRKVLEATSSDQGQLSPRYSLSDDSIPQASVPGLHTAYALLQKQHRETLRKNGVLSNKVRILEKLLPKERCNREETMDDYMKGNCEVAACAGAGASNEDDTVAAELRARQGYISHLEKEVLRNTNIIARGNEEIQRLKRKCDEDEKVILKLQQEHENLKSDFEAVTETLASERELSQKKDEEIQKLKARLGREQQLVSQITSLTEKLHVYELGPVSNKDAEVNSLKSRLTIVDNELRSKDAEITSLKSRLNLAENELRQINVQCSNLNKQVIAKDNEVQGLKIKCRQYEIQVDINKKQSLKESSNVDEVDGDLVLLSQLLQKVADQKRELDVMHGQMHEQQQLIKAITEPKPQIEERGMAVGNSMHLCFQEDDRFNCHVDNYKHELAPSQPFYVEALSPRQGVVSQSPLTRRRSDRTEYRGPNASFTRTPSPRISDAVKPTGNRNIHSMVASEIPAKNFLAANVLDSRVDFSRNSLSNSRPSPAPPATTDRQRRGSGEYYNTSPRTISDQPSPVELPKNDISGIATRQLYNYAPCTKLPDNTQYLNLQCKQENLMRHSTNQIPNRMTQSAIHQRDLSDSSQEVCRYTQQTPLPLELAADTEARLENAHMYVNTSRPKQAPNYENITEVSSGNTKVATEHELEDYENQPQPYVNENPSASSHRNVRESERASPLRASSETRLVTLDPGLEDVSAVKICPSCTKEFSRLTMDAFQAHVYDCFDNGEAGPATIQASADEEDRICPMCSAAFPITIPQEIYEQHVFAHFGEEAMTDGFEMLS